MPENVRSFPIPLLSTFYLCSLSLSSGAFLIGKVCIEGSLAYDDAKNSCGSKYLAGNLFIYRYFTLDLGLTGISFTTMIERIIVKYDYHETHGHCRGQVRHVSHDIAMPRRAGMQLGNSFFSSTGEPDQHIGIKHLLLS